MHTDSVLLCVLLFVLLLILGLIAYRLRACARAMRGGSIEDALLNHVRENPEGSHMGQVYSLAHEGYNYPEPLGGAVGGAATSRTCGGGIGHALLEHVRSDENPEGSHMGQVYSLDYSGPHYPPPQVSGGASGMRDAVFADEILAPPTAAPVVVKKRSVPEPKQHWQLYQTWDSLKRDPGASAEYFRMRTAAVNNPDFEWGQVHEAIKPMLEDNREHIGIIGLKRDGRTLKIIASEASPDEVGIGVTATYFAGVPAELVAKYAERPALFFFHTHPADERASPLPSSPDLATAIYFGATARFAASVVISRYGILVYGISWSAYKSINKADDWKLALMNFTHDTIATNESVRSWGFHTLPDYLQLYARMRLTFYAHPTPAMVATSVQPAIMHSLESEIDHSLIDEYSADIARHIAGKKRPRRGRPAASSHVQWAHPPTRMPHLHLD